MKLKPIYYMMFMILRGKIGNSTYKGYYIEHRIESNYIYFFCNNCSPSIRWCSEILTNYDGVEKVNLECIKDAFLAIVHEIDKKEELNIKL